MKNMNNVNFQEKFSSRILKKIVYNLEVATIIEYSELLSLNSCENCTKITGINENKVMFTLKRFQKTYIFGVY